MSPEKALSCVIHGKYVDADQEIINALQKQIELEPKIRFINDVEVKLCPCCGEVIYQSDYYCSFCGQKINYCEVNRD